MSSDPPEEPHDVAVEQLESFGLSAYAARTFVTLVRRGPGSAREVSDASDVPRTRVYDAVDELRARGLVDVQHASPKEFRPVSIETARSMFEQEMGHRTATMAEALQQLRPESTQQRQWGIWTVSGQEAVTDRVIEFLSNASDDVVFATSEAMLTDDVIDELNATAQRDVTVTLAWTEPAARDRLDEGVTGARLVEADPFSEALSGRFLLIDGEKTLVSALTDRGARGNPNPDTETAIWGAGLTNSLVVVLKNLFGGVA